jgi:hypothetical protein
MSAFLYPTDPQIVHGLKDCIESIPQGENSADGPPPTAAQLVELLNCAFAASQETEEGRPIAFTVDFFGNPAQAFPYQLKHSLPLAPRDLASLAVALDPQRSRICVVPNGTTLRIAGLIHLGEQHAFHGKRQTLRQLSICVFGPGILLVKYNGHLLLTYQRGRFAFHYGRSARCGESAARNALSFRLRPGRSVRQLGVDMRFEAALMRIARPMLEQHHGGTLLILPEGTAWEVAVLSQRFAPAAAVTVVKDADEHNREYLTRRDLLLQQMMEGQVNPELAKIFSDDLIRSSFVAELEWLGRLTATDGMTVILPNLTLLGFGVFFDTRETEDDPTLVVLNDLYDYGTDRQPRPLAVIGGARHQSAAVTCRRFPGASAIVASQDGSLSSMTWNAEERVVYAIRHLELLLDF